MRIFRLKKKIKASNYRNDLNNEREEYLRLTKMRRFIKSTIPNPNVSRIKYVRYADD